MVIKKFKNLFNKNKLAVFVLTFSNIVLAQTAEPEGISQTYIDYMIGFLLLIILFSFAALFYYGFGGEKESAEREQKALGIWQKLKDHLVAATPIEQEDEILLEDDYDGIKELDNRIPPWFNYLFYATIIFGIYYLLNFHVFKTGKLQAEEYKDEMRAAALQKEEMVKTGAVINEETVTLLKDPAALSAGKNIFKTNCVACHGPEAGGIVGPNLTDDYWIHGGGIKNVFKTIKYGVPAKGMITWENILSPKEIQEVASYVISLHGTHPANAKPPQGTKYEPEKENDKTTK